VESINNFISEQVKLHPDKFIGFCSLHPDLSQDEIDAEIERAKSLGLKGIKLHPDFQQFKLDHKKALDMFEVIGDRLPVLIHTGDVRYKFSSPERLVNVMKQFPKLTCIGAHFGGWSEWENAVNLLCDTNAYVDTSSSFYSMDKAKAKEIIGRYSPDRILFGSDYPMWDSKDEIAFLDSLELDEDLLDKIYSKNLLNLLKMD
jgi:predicted TIM-barrel fold metal-dependent hydrolase